MAQKDWNYGVSAKFHRPVRNTRVSATKSATRAELTSFPMSSAEKWQHFYRFVMSGVSRNRTADWLDNPITRTRTPPQTALDAPNLSRDAIISRDLCRSVRLFEKRAQGDRVPAAPAAPTAVSPGESQCERRVTALTSAAAERAGLTCSVQTLQRLAR